jgi:hypothetical protein
MQSVGETVTEVCCSGHENMQVTVAYTLYGVYLYYISTLWNIGAAIQDTMEKYVQE